MNSRAALTTFIVLLTFIIGFFCGFKTGTLSKEVKRKYIGIFSEIKSLPEKIISMPKDAAAKIINAVSSDKSAFDKWTDDLMEKQITVLYELKNKNFDKIKDTVIYEAVNGTTPEILRFIIKNKVVNLSDKDLEDMMFKFCIEQNLRFVDMLIDCGVSVNIKDEDGFSPLYYACRNNNFDLIKLLIKKGGAYLNTVDKYENTPLSYVEDKNIYVYLYSIGAKFTVDMTETDTFRKYQTDDFFGMFKYYLKRFKKTVDDTIIDPINLLN